jgi:hypothetical protein
MGTGQKIWTKQKRRITMFQRCSRIAANLAFSASLFVCGVTLFAQESDELDPDFLLGAEHLNVNRAGGLNGKGNVPTPHGFPLGVDTLVNFTDHFEEQGVYFDGTPRHIWEYSMVGNPPAQGGTTTFNSPIIPVTLDLRNFDGTPRFVKGKPLISRPDAFVQPVLNSPVFSNANFSSSQVPTQFADAIQKAEFGNHARPDWHTLLQPVVKTERTMVLIRGTYRFALNPDGSCCLFVLVDFNTFSNKLIPPLTADNSTVMGAAELAGDITTRDISTFLFPNTFLYQNNNPNDCCVFGFHAWDAEPGDSGNGNQLRLYVMNFASWLSPGRTGNVQDITTLSHEMAELYNDPFLGFDGIHNVTPFWLNASGQCQDFMEVGDAVEDLPNSIFPITLNGFVYHPQNVALLPWFEFTGNSFAIDGAYSYPNESVITALSSTQPLNCGLQ